MNGLIDINMADMPVSVEAIKNAIASIEIEGGKAEPEYLELLKRVESGERVLFWEFTNARDIVVARLDSESQVKHGV